MSKLPFEAPLFWKCLFTIFTLVVIAWVAAVKLMAYEMITPDYVGSFISAVIFSYLVHLWLLPGEYEDDDEYEDEEPEEA